jgi:hypothetical protein
MSERGMEHPVLPRRAVPGQVWTGLLLVAIVALLVAVVLVGAIDHLDLLKKAGAVDDKTGMPGVDRAVSEVKGPLAAGVVASGTVGAGLAAILVAFGSPKGMKVAGLSAGGLGVLAATMGAIE